MIDVIFWTDSMLNDNKIKWNAETWNTNAFGIDNAPANPICSSAISPKHEINGTVNKLHIYELNKL